MVLFSEYHQRFQFIYQVRNITNRDLIIVFKHIFTFTKCIILSFKFTRITDYMDFINTFVHR